jgi:hypothetical protein
MIALTDTDPRVPGDRHSGRITSKEAMYRAPNAAPQRDRGSA